MLSTFVTYQLYSSDMQRSLDRVAADPVAKREAEYYNAHIGEVKSVDDFLGDYRLYSYAMKAYGLEDQIYSKALMKKVLESDLSDTKSFANKLSDDRYREFAKAFNFPAASSVDKTLTAQSAAQSDLTTEAYSEYRVRAGQAQAFNASHYVGTIGSVTSVDQFLNDSAIYSVALASVGIDPAITSKSFIRQVLTSNAADAPAANGDTRYLKLADMLPFNADGSAPAGGLQTAAQANGTVYSYFQAKGLAATAQAASYQVSYYEAQIGQVQTADDFVGDARLLDVALTSVGLDSLTTSSTFVWQVLTSDLADPDSVLNKMSEATGSDIERKAKFKALQAMFTFDTQGNAAAGGAQSTEMITATTDDYLERYQNVIRQKDTLSTSLFKAGVAALSSVTGFMASSAVYSYALKAFDLDPATESYTKIMRVLKSDPSDPKSYARQLRDERYVHLAAAFNFDDKGKVASQRLPQTEASQVATANRYAELLGDDPSKAALAKAKAETADYKAALSSVATIDDFVSNDTILTYALKAYGLDQAKLSKDDLKAILTSDLSDPESAANVRNDKRFVEFAAAFTFTTGGEIQRDKQEVQTVSNLIKTQDFYLQQMLEQEAGNDNEGVRLALYFKRKAPDLKNSYEILADPALLSVVQTALGIPSESSQSDIELQKATIDKRLDLASLDDPRQLEKFVSRFLAMYDLTSGASSAASSPAAIILGGSSSSGIAGIL
ncbi:DUF1217 domain-containing protein [Aurantimonas sp. VKM B-3413]|uniref:DUF1217 domain-containing protein n=1 Tax=Aurantimonas sp. VKM B-3413 TaxID=2779401 RepID=UPI001E5581F4|nr:DUF1217 domain-containing protein [Aurantimonas sp. VKM B-3413]MCB8839060.1 DUF1217 domain-containing protein [Aurantimonas sp. VKM B-3413]